MAADAEPRCSPTPSPADAPPRLAVSDLLTLQLLARGYSLEQVAALRRVEPLWDVERVLTALGASTVRGAIAAAQQRGLII